MENTYDFGVYGGFVDQIYGLADYAYAPPITTVGSVLSDIVYDSQYYSVQSNFELNPVISVEEGGTTFYYYPYMYYGPVYYVYDVPVVLHYQVLDVLEEPYAPEASWSDEITYSDGYYDQAGEDVYAAPETPSESVTSFTMYYEEEDEHLNDAPHDRDDKKEKDNDDNEVSSLGEKTPMNPDCVEEPPAYKKFCTEMEERRKIVCPSSQVRKTFINRGVVKNPSSYENFCRSVADKIKKTGSPGKNSSMNRDSVKESPAFMKFCSEVEERRKILDSSSVRPKTYVNRGTVSDPSSYRKFCQIVEDRMKKQGSVENSPSPGIQKFIDKESSRGDGVVPDEHGLKFKEMIINSAEYLYVQDNLKNPKYYKDLLYKEALKKNPRRNKAVLFDILPVIHEEPLISDDVTAEISCGDSTQIEQQELVSDDGVSKPKQRKGKWKSFRNWWSKKFSCCCSTKDPP